MSSGQTMTSSNIFSKKFYGYKKKLLGNHSS